MGGEPMSLLWLPDAIRDAHGRDLTFTTSSDPKGVLHTTETSGWPDYQSWTVHPHMTVMPWPGEGVRIRQHVPFDRASFSLRNEPGGVETNRDRAYQIELVGTCYPGGPGYRWYQADDAVLADLFEKVISPMSAGLNIPLKALPFQAYPDSYGPRSGTNSVRLSGAAWDGYSGWLGHQHVVENSHGDPGLFPWARMMEASMALTTEDKAWLKALVQAEVAKVWDADVIPVKTPDVATNPTWQADNALGHVFDRCEQIIKAVDALPDTVPSVPASPVDVGALAEQLAILLPAHDAQAIAEAVTQRIFGDRLAQ
jgi:hypothetical protein